MIFLGQTSSLFQHIGLSNAYSLSIVRTVDRRDAGVFSPIQSARIRKILLHSFLRGAKNCGNLCRPLTKIQIMLNFDTCTARPQSLSDKHFTNLDWTGFTFCCSISDRPVIKICANNLVIHRLWGISGNGILVRHEVTSQW